MRGLVAVPSDRYLDHWPESDKDWVIDQMLTFVDGADAAAALVASLPSYPHHRSDHERALWECGYDTAVLRVGAHHEALGRRAVRAEAERDAALAEVERWKSASGLVCGGDPDGVTPEACERYWRGVEERLGAAIGLLSELWEREPGDDGSDIVARLRAVGVVIP